MASQRSDNQDPEDALLERFWSSPIRVELAELQQQYIDTGGYELDRLERILGSPTYSLTFVSKESVLANLTEGEED